MPKNLLVQDVLPKNEVAIDILPKNKIVEDIISENVAIDPQTTTRSYSVVIGAGQPIGLLLVLTYPTTGTVLQWGDSGGVTQ